jgi:hypothetical protein
MSQTFNALVSGTTLFSQLYGIINNNQAALRTHFSGATQPGSPSTYQDWMDTTTGFLKIYNGAAFVGLEDYLEDFQTTKTEIESARGTASSLEARLNVSMNPDGTLKDSLAYPYSWLGETDNVAYVSANSFTVSGDERSVYTNGRRLYLDQTSNVFVSVVSATLSATVTTVTIIGGAVDSGLDAGVVYYGQDMDNSPTTLPWLNLNEVTATPNTLVDQGAVYVRNDGTQTELFFREESTGDEVQITKGGLLYTPNVTLEEVSATPTTAANYGAIYVKNDGTQTELFFREESDGDEVQITYAGALPEKKVAIASGYNIKASMVTSATVNITADELVLKDTNGISYLATSVDVTVDITDSGANGLDTGAEANSTWYYVWVIYNPTTDTVAGLLSISATAPTMPAGYTFKALVSAAYNNVSSNINGYYQVGNRYYWAPSYNTIVIAGGVSTAIATIDCSAVVPSIAVDGEFVVRAYCLSTAGGQGSSKTLFSPLNGSISYADYAQAQAPVSGSAFDTIKIPIPFVTPQTAYYQIVNGAYVSTGSGDILCKGFTLPGGGM